MRRYSKNIPIDLGKRFSTSYMIPIIRAAVKEGRIRFRVVVLQEEQRLDTVAGKYYNNGGDYWIIAAASGIGFSLQCPPGTVLTVPYIEDIEGILG